VIFAERTKTVAFPERTPRDQIEQWAKALYSSISWCRNNRSELTLNAEARQRYEDVYTSEWSQSSGNELVDALLERAPAVALRLAITFAILDQHAEINADHMNCAIAWSRYWKESVEFVWRDRVRLSRGNGQDATVQRNAEKIIEYLKANAGKAYRTELITKCFHGHLRVAELDLALEFLELQTPRRIVTKRIPKAGKPGQLADMIELYRPSAKTPCEPGECGEPEATVGASADQGKFSASGDDDWESF
jgi:hypothetical protein